MCGPAVVRQIVWPCHPRAAVLGLRDVREDLLQPTSSPVPPSSLATQEQMIGLRPTVQTGIKPTTLEMYRKEEGRAIQVKTDVYQAQRPSN